MRSALAGCCVAMAFLLPRAPSARAEIVVLDRHAGARLATVWAERGEEIRLEYRHSVYEARGAEIFEVTGGGLRLVALESDSVAVLEYYARPERVVRTNDRYRIDVAAETFDELPLLPSVVGQRTLVHGAKRLRLDRLTTPPRPLTIRIAGTRPAGAVRP